MQLLQDPYLVTILPCIVSQRLGLRTFVVYLNQPIEWMICINTVDIHVEEYKINLHFRACSANSLMTAFSMIGNVHKCSNSASGKPCLMANSFKCFGFGTTKATVNCFDGSPYTQMFSTTAQVFNSASTLPNDTYSPACNFTKSFLRSEKINATGKISLSKGI